MGNKTKAIAVLMIGTLLSACVSIGNKGEYKQFTGQVTLTGGFDFERMRDVDIKGSRLAGDEFLASFTLPEGVWTRGSRRETERETHITLSAPNYYGMDIQWHWLSPQGKKQLIDTKSSQIPWYTGVRDTTFKRIPYTPTQEQLKSGDWNQSGYSQRQWHQHRLLGKKQYYCRTILLKSNNRTAWNAENGVPIGNRYSYNWSCPFRLTDGRDAKFVIHTGFFIESTNTQNKAQSNAQDNQAQIEAKLAEIDAQLKPIWDSLQVNSKAYQFNINKE